MRISRQVVASAVTAGCIAASAAPSALANSKSTRYTGKTRDGDPISLVLSGSKVSRLKAYVPTLCGTSDAGGLPLTGSDPFDPPGSFPLGTRTQRKAKRENAIWNTNTVTKNFVVRIKRGRHGVITGRLHVDYSFLMLVYSDPISARPYVCTGDSTFSLNA